MCITINTVEEINLYQIYVQLRADKPTILLKYSEIPKSVLIMNRKPLLSPIVNWLTVEFALPSYRQFQFRIKN